MKIRTGFVSNSSSSSFIINNVTPTTILSTLNTLFEFIDNEQEQNNLLSYNFNLLINNYGDLYTDFLNSKYGMLAHTSNYDTYLTNNGGTINVETCHNLSWENLNLNIDMYDESNDFYNILHHTNRQWLHYFIDLNNIANRNNVHSANIYPNFEWSCCEYSYSIVFNRELKPLCSNCLNPINMKRRKNKKEKPLDKSPLNFIS